MEHLGLSTFTDPDRPRAHWPKLKGKGAEIRDVIEPLLLVFREHRRPGNADDGRIVALLEAQVRLQRILPDNSSEVFLTHEQAMDVRNTIDTILQLYTLLANAADMRKTLVFNMVPKFHFLWHLGYRAFWLNPRKGCTMVDEDYMGVVKRIAASCVHGSPPHKVPKAVMDKIIWGQHFLAVYGDTYPNATC